MMEGDLKINTKYVHIKNQFRVLALEKIIMKTLKKKHKKVVEPCCSTVKKQINCATIKVYHQA